MKLLIAGSRTISDYSIVRNFLDGWPKKHEITHIVSGGAQGVDGLALRYAKENNLLIKLYLPEWGVFGRAAGPIRNQKMLADSDLLLAVWDGESRGTLDMIKRWKEQKGENSLKILTIKP